MGVTYKKPGVIKSSEESPVQINDDGDDDGDGDDE
jgi:hypothetical protein